MGPAGTVPRFRPDLAPRPVAPGSGAGEPPARSSRTQFSSSIRSPAVPHATDVDAQTQPWAALPEPLRQRAAALWPVAQAALEQLYGAREDWAAVCSKVMSVVAQAAAARPADLKALDAAREAEPDWFQKPDLVGYSTYVDRFAGTLDGVGARIGYLKELGVRALHLLPVMRVADGPSDGGFAMASHTEVDPRWGSTETLRALAKALRDQRISLCLDLLCNHTSAEHPWARAAAAGDPRYLDHFIIVDAAEVPSWEAHLGEVFPQTAPGNFSPMPGHPGKMVWTTFYPYQWDLNYANPAVFSDMLAVMLELANLGAETLRLDSVAYMWKRRGTACRNLPEVHAILMAFRALIGIAAPALLLKAEAVVETAATTAYLGQPDAPPECQLAYNNPLMIAVWSALADGEAAELGQLLSRLPDKPPGTSWVTYVRCHDDIGWMLLARDRGPEGAARAAFLSDFYAGTAPGSFASGGRFQAAPGAGAHGGVGSSAALTGLDRARASGDPGQIDLAIRRMLLVHALIAATPGTPTLWMGDEIGLTGAGPLPPGTWAAEDARATNRPFMDWQAVERRHDPASVEGRLHAGMRQILTARAALPAFHAALPVHDIATPHRSVLAFERGGGAVRVLANLSPEAVRLEQMPGANPDMRFHDMLAGGGFAGDGPIVLEPYACVWLVASRHS